jgi:hypothetical protein
VHKVQGSNSGVMHILSKCFLRRPCTRIYRFITTYIFMDSNQSSLSQLVTRYTQYGRFIRRCLFGLRPSTDCQLVLGLAECSAQSVGHVTVQTRPGWARAELPIVEHDPGPARARGGAQWCGPRAGRTLPGRGAVRRQSDAGVGRPAGPAREGHVKRRACLGGSVQRVRRVGQGCRRRVR